MLIKIRGGYIRWATAAADQFCEALNHPVRPIDTDLIFNGEPGHDGNRRFYQFNPVWMKKKREQGLADVRFHGLRHEAVSRFVEAGFSDQEVSPISGHKSMQMLKRYSHLRAEDLVASQSLRYRPEEPLAANQQRRQGFGDDEPFFLFICGKGSRRNASRILSLLATGKCWLHRTSARALMSLRQAVILDLQFPGRCRSKRS